MNIVTKLKSVFGREHSTNAYVSNPELRYELDGTVVFECAAFIPHHLSSRSKQLPLLGGWFSIDARFDSKDDALEWLDTVVVERDENESIRKIDFAAVQNADDVAVEVSR